jgi:hypothetical protein
VVTGKSGSGFTTTRQRSASLDAIVLGYDTNGAFIDSDDHETSQNHRLRLLTAWRLPSQDP